MRQHAGRKPMENNQAGKRERAAGEEGEDRGAEQIGGRGKCVKKKRDLGKASCSQSYSLTSRISMLLLKDMTTSPLYLSYFHPI